MKPQVIFNKVVRHLFKQNKKCVDPKTDNCLYRGDNNTKCAIGALIPNRLYDSDMENLNVESVMNRFAEVCDLIGFENIHLLRVLQEVHDDASLTVKMTLAKKQLRSSLKGVAEEYKLSTKVLSEV